MQGIKTNDQCCVLGVTDQLLTETSPICGQVQHAHEANLDLDREVQEIKTVRFDLNLCCHSLTRHAIAEILLVLFAPCFYYRSSLTLTSSCGEGKTFRSQHWLLRHHVTTTTLRWMFSLDL